MTFSYVFRIIISLMAAGLFGLCIVKLIWTKADRVRTARVLGLTIISAAIAWGATGWRNQPFKPWLVLTFVGLCFCIYGMARSTDGEQNKFELSQKSTESS